MKRGRGLPTFLLSATPPGARSLSRHAAAARLGIAYDSLVKLIRAGILDEPLHPAAVDVLATRHWLTARTGELTVLRTDGPPTVDAPTRRPFGFAVDVTDDYLADAALGPWRSDPERVERNQLLAVVLSTVPVAVYDIDRRGPAELDTRGHPRYTYSGTLLARLGPSSLGSRRGEAPTDSAGNAVIIKNPDLPVADPRITTAEIIMHSRIRVDSRGPIGYL
ncbi:hypothetical protein MUG78_17510 [Gordonia alkaliphila]|uniref:hypothetical protein n=1 Tax=Gordonia alkaliphila TaxID=1053547 RepID=UPI001FF184A3|nr:hypothetical protein [Gordonia alkaliphila]MCK0441199.1 hypothetical protein [Gordonia alkaliphila]